MSTASTHFKLGLFTLIGIAALFAAAFGLGLSGKSETISYHTYFDETVQGLEVGSPVKYRGVLIGSVAAIAVAPDRKHVDVTLALNERDVHRLGLAEQIPPDVRAQMGTQGITGVKFVDIDFFDPKSYPPPQLPFQPAENYIPATPSLLKGLADNVDAVGQRLPALVDAAVDALHSLQVILTDFQDQRIPGRLSKAVDDVDGAAGDLRALVQHVDRAKIPDKTAAAIDTLGTALAQVNTMLDTIAGDGGLVASTQRATDSIGDLGRSTTSSADELDKTLRDLDEAALAIRELAESVDRDPDMLLKGRGRTRKP